MTSKLEPFWATDAIPHLHTTEINAFAAVMHVLNRGEVARPEHPAYESLFEHQNYFFDDKPLTPNICTIGSTSKELLYLAETISEYYISRCVQKKLSGGYVGEWEDEVTSALQLARNNQIHDDSLPALSKLQAFYDFDMAMRNFSEHFDTMTKHHNCKFEAEAVIQVVGKCVPPQRNHRSTTFLAVTENNHLIGIPLHLSSTFTATAMNSFLTMPGLKLKVNGWFETKHDIMIPDFTYARATGIEVVGFEVTKNHKPVVNIYGC